MEWGIELCAKLDLEFFFYFFQKFHHHHQANFHKKNYHKQITANKLAALNKPVTLLWFYFSEISKKMHVVKSSGLSRFC